MCNEYPKRRRWDGDRDNLAYDVGDGVEDGELAVVKWVDHYGDSHHRKVEIGTFEPHNSWLSMFAADGSGDYLAARPDGVLMLEYYPDEEPQEVGEVKRVTPEKAGMT